MKEEYRAITLEWLNKVESDFDYARASFREFDRFYSQMCILCHDAAEKYLKSYLTSLGISPERTHDLVMLLKEYARHAENSGDLLTIERPCRILNRYYIPLKYPFHYPNVTREQANEAIEAAEAVRTVVVNVLGIAS
jgi:HEPN domain-containing protein